ncbi:MAG: starch-binding protein [Bacteroidota bacterium]
MLYARYTLTCLLAFLLSGVGLMAQNNTDVLLQGFNWESEGNTLGWYNVIASKAADLSASGIDMVWFPPSSDAADNHGYLPRELYDQNSNYGTQVELQAAITALHNEGIKAIGDIVINHRVGSTNWADFTNPTWGCWAVTAQDEWGQNGGNPCGNWDTGDNYSAARDIDHTNATVQNDIITWMNWLKNTIGFDGWRYDYIRGYSGYYNGLYDNATSTYFSVGELWDNLNINDANPHRQQIINWIDQTNGTSHAFDFTTKGILQQAVNGELWRLSNNGGAPGVIGWYPARSVTFVDNHDTGSTQNYWPFPGGKVMQGYAYIMTHPGVPTVFWDHFYDWGLHDDIADLVQIRKRNGLHSTSTLDIKVAQGNLYAAEIDGKVAMKIGPGSWSPAGSGWTLAAFGNDYAVWEKASAPCNDNLTVHFKNTSGWGNPTIYFWNPTPSGPSTTWPGEAMTNDGNEWYSYTLACAECSNIIFSNNGASQSANLYRCDEGWYNGSWHSSNPDAGGGNGDLTVHFRPTSYSNPEIYFWNVTPSGQSTSWPGVGMQNDGNGWYSYTFNNANCANFIFSNNGGSQSPDLSSCTEVWVTEGNWNFRKAAPTKIDVSISPNPSSGVFLFQFETATETDQQLQIVGLDGRVIRQERISAQTSTYKIDLTQLAKGLYMYRLSDGEGLRTGKLMVSQ